MLIVFFGAVPGGRRCRARRRLQSSPADPACDNEVVGEGAPVVVVGGARKDSLAVRETGLSVILPGVPAVQPQVTSGERSRAVSLSSSCGARIEAKGLSGGSGTLLSSVVVASLRRSVGCVGCRSMRGASFGRQMSLREVY